MLVFDQSNQSYDLFLASLMGLLQRSVKIYDGIFYRIKPWSKVSLTQNISRILDLSEGELFLINNERMNVKMKIRFQKKKK